MKIYSFSPFGYEGALVRVEVDLRRGIPQVDIVGLADSAIKESRERMRSAIRNSGLEFPPERVLISLSPADLKKEGAGFDLAVALAVLDEKYSLENKSSGSEKILVMGELELNGKIRPVRGLHAAACTAVAEGITKCIVPKDNFLEAHEVKGIKVYGAETLNDAWNAFLNPIVFEQDSKTPVQAQDTWYDSDTVVIDGIHFPPVTREMDFCDVKNQEDLVLALQIAAAGGHNILAYGPPGCGKTLSMQKFPSIIPCLTPEQSQSVTRIYSIAGLLSRDTSAMKIPPFRTPHQTATIEGMCGGGIHCSPGEISLSHNGILFLDEAAEFKSCVLQMLRVPMETKKITLCRAGRSTVYPADFQLLMSTNPCPCGNYGSEKLCLCSAKSVETYWKKLSGPLLDRVDIRVKVAQKEGRSYSSAELRTKVAKAIKTQMERQGKLNAKLTASELNEICVLQKDAYEKLSKEILENDFSSRASSSILKVARTLADMEGNPQIELQHIEKATALRKPEGIEY